MHKVLTALLLVLATALQAAAQEMPVIDIVYDGTTANVNIPDGITDVINQTPAGSSHVRLTSTTAVTEYAYRISGTTTDGSLYINGAYKLTLELDGVSITNPSVLNNNGYAIDVEVGKRIAVVVNDDTYNYLCDAPLGAQKACMYFKGHPEFQGGGTLEVLGQTKHAISAKEYLQIKKNFGTLHILGAVSDGIHCGKGTTAVDPESAAAENNNFRMAGGNIVIENVGGDAIDADDYGNVTITGGYLSFSVTNFDGKGIKCDNRLIIDGGTIDYTVTGEDAVGIQCNNQLIISGGNISATIEGDGSKAIKANNKADGFFPDGGYATIGLEDGTGPNIEVTLRGGTYEATDGSDSRCTALTVDRDLNFLGGSIYVNVENSEARPTKVDGTALITGGVIITNGAYYTVREYDFQHDMHLYASLTIGGTPIDPTTSVTAPDDNLTDALAPALARYQLAAFVDDECRGVATPIFTTTGDFICYSLRTYSNVANGEELTFRIYDTKTGTEYKADQTLTFATDGSAGTPSTPFALNVTFSIGDVSTAIDHALKGQATLEDIHDIANSILHIQ